MYFLIVGSWQIYLYHQRFLLSELKIERLQRSFSDARLNLLRMQLDSHFLFNTLNTVSSQIVREPGLARNMIEHLSVLLRLSLDLEGAQRITLAEELAFLDHYLAIQLLRFGDHLTVTLDIGEGIDNVLVPSVFLQPLVENAIRHGISSKLAGGEIIVSAHRAGAQIVIKVLDDGVGLPLDWALEKQAGLGLKTTRERFIGLYAQAQVSFELARRAEHGTAVHIAFPAVFVEAST